MVGGLDLVGSLFDLTWGKSIYFFSVIGNYVEYRYLWQLWLTIEDPSMDGFNGAIDPL